MFPNKLYVAFDVFGNPFGVSPRLEDFSYHPAERTGEYVKAEVADLLANAKVDLMAKIIELEDRLRVLLKDGNTTELSEEERRKIATDYVHEASDWTFMGFTPLELRMAVNHWNRYRQERQLSSIKPTGEENQDGRQPKSAE